jgi:hypothetical protein
MHWITFLLLSFFFFVERRPLLGVLHALKICALLLEIYYQIMLIHLNMRMNMSITLDARETSPLVGDLGGSHDKHVDFVSDLPSSGAAFVNAAAVLDARLDSINIEKDGSSSLATSAPMTAVSSDSVVVSTEKAVEKAIPR